MATVIRGDDNFDTTPSSSGRVLRTSGDITTTSTSLVDVAGASITLTTGAHPVAYGASGPVECSAQADVRFNVSIDDALQHGTTGISIYVSTANQKVNGSYTGQSAALTAGSHTIKEKWSVHSGTGYLYAGTAQPRMFYAREVK